MKLLKNAQAVYQVVRAVAQAKPSRDKIDAAREAGDFELERKLISDACKTWADKLVRDYDMHVSVINPEFMPTFGPCVYVCNHQSYLDVVAFYSIIQTQVGFVAKDAFKKIPFFKSWLIRIRCIFINRGNPRSALETMNLGVSYLEDGFNMVIFPEGTRGRGKEMKTFKPGSFKLATKSGAPIIPVSINGTYKVYEGPGVITRGEEMSFTFHEPIPTAGLSRTELLELPKKCEEIIKKDVITG